MKHVNELVKSYAIGKRTCWKTCMSELLATLCNVRLAIVLDKRHTYRFISKAYIDLIDYDNKIANHRTHMWDLLYLQADSSMLHENGDNIVPVVTSIQVASNGEISLSLRGTTCTIALTACPRQGQQPCAVIEIATTPYGARLSV